MITFKVDDVVPKVVASEKITNPLVATFEAIGFDSSQSAKYAEMQHVKTSKALGIKHGTIEAYKSSSPGCNVTTLDMSTPAFLETCLLSYDQHVPLMLSPDDVWITVCQAIGKHIEAFPEDCRKAIVDFDGKKYLEVRADHFVAGSPDNNWEWAFGQFGNMIEEYLGKKRDLFDPSFSTTTPTTKAAIQVQMMSALSSYFEYGMRTCCGIPEITLMGTTDDWKAISNRVDAFGEFYPEWALRPMQHVIGNFVAASEGQADLSFWKNFVKVSGGSGGPFVSGFINAFYPYYKSGGKAYPNHLLAPRTNRPQASFVDLVMSRNSGPVKSDLPASTSAVDMTWHYHGQQKAMKLLAGVLGTSVDTSVHASGAYRPIVGWAVAQSAGE